MVKVSVIVPVYNVEKYLGRCLNSLLEQTLDDLEIIVIDDGSTDSSSAIAEKYSMKYPNKLQLYRKQNGGLSDARNYGMQFVRGEYVAFLDSDDYVEKDTYRKLYSTAKKACKKVVVCGYTKEWDSRCESVVESGYESIEEYLAYGETIAWNKIYKWEWLKKTEVFFPEGLRYEDMEFFPCMLSNLDSLDDIGFVCEPLIHYTQRSDSITYAETDKVTDIWEIVNHVLSYYKTNEISNELNEAIEFKFVKALLGSFLLKYNRISNCELRKKLQKEHWNFIITTFPNYKSNSYIRRLKIGHMIYLKLMCKPLYILMCNIPKTKYIA